MKPCRNPDCKEVEPEYYRTDYGTCKVCYRAKMNAARQVRGQWKARRAALPVKARVLKLVRSGGKTGTEIAQQLHLNFEVADGVLAELQLDGVLRARPSGWDDRIYWVA